MCKNWQQLVVRIQNAGICESKTFGGSTVAAKKQNKVIDMLLLSE